MSFSRPKKSPFRTSGENEAYGRLNLTALLDILSNILFFLLASFGAQSLELVSEETVQLPSSTSELSLRMSLSVAVGLNGLYVEDEPVADLQNGRFVEVVEGAFIPSLEQTLRRVRAQRLARNERPRDADEVVLFIGDKRLQFETIDKVMKTCARVGFTKFRFAVAR
ncbi:MAG: biopolymer transporter ExbD [Myxococcales bacterium]|nr:biopolymer transporter ExbD [Myxococcales bacterium]